MKGDFLRKRAFVLKHEASNCQEIEQQKSRTKARNIRDEELLLKMTYMYLRDAQERAAQRSASHLSASCRVAKEASGYAHTLTPHRSICNARRSARDISRETEERSSIAIAVNGQAPRVHPSPASQQTTLPSLSMLQEVVPKGCGLIETTLA